MFNATRLRRSAIVAALACAALAATAGAAAAAQPNDCRVQLGAGLDFVPCYRDPDPQHTSTRTRSDDSPRLTAALAQERYYSSYGEPEPIAAALAPAPTDRAPWPSITLAATIALAATSIAAIHRRRLRLRRRVARATS